MSKLCPVNSVLDLSDFIQARFYGLYKSSLLDDIQYEFNYTYPFDDFELEVAFEDIMYDTFGVEG